MAGVDATASLLNELNGSSLIAPARAMTRPASDTALSIRGLSKSYRIGHGAPKATTLAEAVANRFFRRTNPEAPRRETFWALQDVSFDVRKGDVVGIIGSNGAGKSTLLKILSRITTPTAGRADIYGRVGSLLEVGTGFHPELTGRENIFLNGQILGMSRAEIRREFDAIVNFAGVERFIDTPVKRYSSGMYVRLAFAVAAHLRLEILIVDEVLAVGDIAFQKKCLGKMGEVAHDGRTVLFVSHNMAALQSLCRSGVLLQNGSVAAQGPIARVIEPYLKRVYERAASGQSLFPALSEKNRIGINYCDITLKEDVGVTLVVDIEIETREKQNTIGVGIAVRTVDGVKVSVLGPSLTNYVLDEVEGRRRCRFRCERVNEFLAGGDYVLSVWLSKPRTEYLLTVDDAGIFSVPGSDPYGAGVENTWAEHGCVPLRATFEVL